jgi:hypothetical protein
VEPIRLFDSFYADPLWVREAALTGEFRSVPGGFQGQECRLPEMDIVAVMDRIASILGFPIEYFLERQGVFRSLTAVQERQKLKQVHVDRMGFSGLLVLSDSYPFSKTGFYRHRDTGLFGVGDESALKRIARRRGQSVRELLLNLNGDGNDLSRWDLVDSVEYRFNRLIVFDSDRFHVAGAGVGSHLHDSKLTQNFNFYRLERWKLWHRARVNARSLRLDVRRPY